MTAETGMARNSTAVANGPGASPRVVAGRYRLERVFTNTPLAEVWDSVDIQSGALLTTFVLHKALSPALDEAIEGAQNAAPLAHANAARVVFAGQEDDTGYIVTERLVGSTLADVLSRRRQAGNAGLPAQGALGVARAVAAALAAAHDFVSHGAIDPNFIFVRGDGRVCLAGFGLGDALARLVAAGAVAPPRWLAKEILASGHATPSGDSFAFGALLYEMLVGGPVGPGAQRPSDVAGVSPLVDQLISRCLAPDPSQRPQEGIELVALIEKAFAEPAARPSLSQEISTPSPAVVAGDESNNPALADTVEKWLVNKGRMDYGPYSMAGVVKQIRAHQIVPGNVIVDNHSGERCKVEDHPLLTKLVERVTMERDDARRAQAEVAHASSEKRRGVALYGFIAAGIAAVALIAYFIVAKARKADGPGDVAGVSSVTEAQLAVKIGTPKTEAAPKRSGGGRRSSGSRGSSGGDDTLALDMSNDSGGSETLDPGQINNVVTRHGGSLGRCLSKTGSRYAGINFTIEGPTGKVTKVTVNGESSGGLQSCIAGAMRSMKFPPVDGPRTRAEFDISM